MLFLLWVLICLTNIYIYRKQRIKQRERERERERERDREREIERERDTGYLNVSSLANPLIIDNRYTLLVFYNTTRITT